MARVVLAMSGGVDSSVAAHLLLQQGHEVVGVFMRHGEESAEVCRAPDGSESPVLPIVQGRADHKQGCCSASDAADARRVSDRLGIPFYALNLKQDFRRIIDYFVDEYSQGRTPNPCVQCNNWIKFGRLFEYADSIDAQYVATGHYAQLSEEADGSFALRRGVDDRKDQSYVLFGIGQHLLSRMLLPVGGYDKPWIRQQAEAIGLRVAGKPDSQEICFVTSGHHGQFVRDRSGGGDTAGQIVTTAGDVVGEHPGIEAFTIGQRKGLGVAMGEPYFVVRIEPDTHRVVIGQKADLARDGLIAHEANWLIDPPAETFSCSVQIRYNSPPQAAQVTPQGTDRFDVLFDEPVDGVAPGQAAVIYDGDRVLGGGWIHSSTSTSAQ
ncbi:tRNA 2-thiouridine(34) synthase MnmA [Rosistilla oblonga]|uniref:tRNA 2-thiouridine(34) synthase MnmA n=1 Tax=Rosistilla oblonga TaxID=2527990 RepID=UPI003A974301